jgi:hypothetical protein
MDRGAAAKIGGMERQTLRDWVHRFNASGPEGLIDNWTEGPLTRADLRSPDRQMTVGNPIVCCKPHVPRGLAQIMP